MNRTTRNKLAVLLGAGAVSIAALDRLFQPEAAQANPEAVAAETTAAEPAKAEPLATVFGSLPVETSSVRVLSEVMRAGDRAGVLTRDRESPENRAPVEGASRVALPVLSAVSTASGGVAVIEGAVLRVGHEQNGVQLLSVTGRSATVLIQDEIHTLTIR